MKSGMILWVEWRNTYSDRAAVERTWAAAVKSGANFPVRSVSGYTEWHSVHHAIA